MVFAWCVRVVDDQRRPVEAFLELSQRIAINTLVDLDREQQSVGEHRRETIHDVAHRRTSAPEIETGHTQGITPRWSNERDHDPRRHPA